ncbi:MAG: 4Fe-4S binding protein [Lachnospiraceae bacterium]
MSKMINNELKKGGFLKQVQKDKYSMRLHVIGGQISAEQLLKIKEISEKFGKGYVHITSRQGIEIPFVDFNDIVIVKQELEKAGLSLGASGQRVRGVVACQGNSICNSGLIETSELAREIDTRYFNKDLPHKFKIGITGCKNNCLKAEENDLGIKGAAIVSWNADNCNFCGACKNVCKWNVIRINKTKKTLNFNEKKCENCGKCTKVCPRSCWSATYGYKVFIGGTFGKNIITGEQLVPIIMDKETLFEVIDTTIEYFAEFAKSKERLIHTIKRNGDDILKERLKCIVS